MDSRTTTRRFAGIKVSPLSRAELLSRVAAGLEGRQSLRLTFLNPDYARRALLDPELAAAINDFDVVAVDGNGVRLLTPLYGFTVPERLDTDSLAPGIFELVARHGGSVFLLGCAPGVAARAGAHIVAQNPGVRVAGTESGFHDIERGHPGRFAPQDSERIVAAINDSGADLLVVSLPTPLQQRWVEQYGDRLHAPVVMTAGSYLDHVAEGIAGRWYPRWADALMLNWLYRLGKDPRRLWRRYTLEILDLLRLVLRDRWTRTRLRRRSATAARRSRSAPPHRPG